MNRVLNHRGTQDTKNFFLKLFSGRAWAIVLALACLLSIPIAAQDDSSRSIAYGETLSAYFEGETSHEWSFTGSAGEIIEVKARRIGGRFEPSLSLLAPSGLMSSELDYYRLGENGVFTLRVTENNDMNSSLLILNEYSLSLNLLGRQRDSIEDGLEALPGIERLPALFTGEGSLEATLGLNIFGSATLSQPDPVAERSIYVLRGSRTVRLDNASALSRGFSAIDFDESGVALQSTGGGVFFTDQDINSLETSGGITSIGLADGTSILTDFHRISSIQAQDNLVIVNFVDGQKLIAEGQSFEFLRRGGVNGEGPNAEDVNIIRVDGAELQSDLEAWQTLALLGSDVRVYYDELRYLGEAVAMTLFSDEAIYMTDGEASFTIDPLGMGDVVLRGDSLVIRPLDGREIVQARSPVYDVSIQNRIITIRLEDGSSKLSLPDGSLIESPSAIPVDNAALPNQAGFRPRNFNNLGAKPYDYHPMPDFDFALFPVNRVNGNFFYQVSDFALESDSLGLEWTRFYNSMGQGWRHSYQYELDLAYLPLGELWLSLPDGSRHIFAEEGAVYRSSSLLSWTIQQREDGSWEAFTTEGLRYDFDQAGRLETIHQGIYSLVFSPVPREYLGAYRGGFFVTDSYGRRIEAYADENGLIRELRDVLGRSIRYSYNGRDLVSVDYSHNEDMVSYTYLAGLLSTISEGQDYAIQYDVQGRVSRYVVNPDGELQAVREFSYDIGETREIQFINGTEQAHIYSYDESFRLSRYDSPFWIYRWAYSLQTGRLSEYAQPDFSVLRYQFDEFGYLSTFTDPLFGAGTGPYRFHYISPDNRLRLLSAVDIPANDNYLRLDYDAENRLSVMNQAGYTTSYVYDAMGRVETVSRPDRTIAYTYDDFGYVSSINEGEGARIIQQSHDILGRLLSETDGRGTVTSYLWSSSHNRLDSKRVDDWLYEYTYDVAGNLTGSRFNGREEFYSYDDLNHLASYVDSLERISRYVHDEAGNLLSVSYPDGSVESYEYDFINQRTSFTDSNGLETRYEVGLSTENNRTSFSVNYPSGESTRFTYDPLGRLRQVTSRDRTDEQSFSYNLTYNALGYLTTIEESHVPAGRRLSIDYDLQGNPTSASLNNAATSRYDYDEAGRLIRETDPEGRATGYEYDVMGNVIRVTMPDGSSLGYGYDENGNRTSYTEAGGLQWFYTYDKHNRLTTVIDPANNLTSYEYDNFGNLSAIVNANGNRVDLSYDDASRLSQYTDLSGNLTSYQYNQRNNIIGIEQEGGLSSDFFYDAADNLTALTQSGGRESLYARDNEGRITGITDSLGNSRFYAYNTIGTIGRITNPLGDVTSFRWSASGRIVGYSSSSGAAYSYSGDSIGRLTNMNDVATNQTIALNTAIDYDDSGYIEAIRFGTTGSINGNQAIVHRYTYTPNGQIASYLPPESSAPYSFEYDVNGRMTRSVDPLGTVTLYAYDAMGSISEIRRAAETDFEILESFTYDALGNVKTYSNSAGLLRTFNYNSANQLTEQIDNGERVYAYGYDAYGRITSSTDPNGQVTNYLYDLYGNLIVTERGEFSTRYEYDEVNNLRRVESPAGQSVLMSYNAMGQRVRYTDAENNAWSYSYDDAGNLSQVSDPLGNNTAYRYDVTNRLVSILFPDDSLIELIYDNRGTVSELRLPNNQRIRTGFDLAGNLSSVEYAPNQVVRYERDNLGRVTRQTNADGTSILYGYDAHGNLILREANAISQNRAYDDAGRLTELSQGSNVIAYEYNNFGDLEAFDSPQMNASYDYDAAGNLLTRDVGEFGRMDYSYDALYRPSQITMGSETVALDYDENGWRTQLLRSNGLETRYVYDDNGRVRNILHLNAEGERLDGFAYEYDAVGNILRVTRIDNWAVLYSYDEAQHLISERWLSDDNQVRYSVSYVYDAAGNRAEQTTRVGQGNPERTLFIYNNQNQLIEEIRNAEFTIEDRLALPLIGGLVVLPLAWFLRRRPRYLPLALAIIPLGIPFFQAIEPPSINYSYDANGNLSSIAYDTGNTLNFSYDAFQRLVAIDGATSAGATIGTTIRYDALGNVSQIIENEIRYTLIYDAIGLVAMESNGTRTLYFTALGETLLMNTTEGALWPLQDALGMARTYATSEGELIAGLNRTSFGELINPYEVESTVPSPQPLSDGSIYLGQAQIYLRGERAYEPRLGIELQRPALPDYVFSDFNPLDAALLGLNPTVPELEPNRLVPNPSISLEASFLTVASAQAAETERLLHVAEMAYGQVNQPNILQQTAMNRMPMQVEGLGVQEGFAASLREVPLYAPLVHELPRLLAIGKEN